jgi:hypothetical protein
MFSERFVGHAQCLPERVGVSGSPGRDDLHVHLLDKRSALQLHYTCTAYAWCHYGGHFLTKSHRYSVTFGQLRKARTDHRRAERHPGGERDPWGRPLNETVVLVISTWTYAGTGYTAAPAVQLALASAARAREH